MGGRGEGRGEGRRSGRQGRGEEEWEAGERGGGSNDRGSSCNSVCALTPFCCCEGMCVPIGGCRYGPLVTPPTPGTSAETPCTSLWH